MPLCFFFVPVLLARPCPCDASALGEPFRQLQALPEAFHKARNQRRVHRLDILRCAVESFDRPIFFSARRSVAQRRRFSLSAIRALRRTDGVVVLGLELRPQEPHCSAVPIPVALPRWKRAQQQHRYHKHFVQNLSVEEAEKIHGHLHSIVGLTDVDFVKLASLAPGLEFGYLSHSQVSSVLHYLSHMGLDQHEIRHVILKWPHVLARPVNSDLVLKYAFLMSIGLSRADIRRLIASQPTVLRCPLETMQTRCTLLADAGLDVVKVFKKDPAVLELRSAAKVANEVMSYLLELGVARVKASKMLSCYPSILMLNLDCLKTKVHTLRSWGLPTHDVTRVISAAPSMLQLSVELLEKKRDILLSMQYTLRDLVACPRYLTSNAQRRVKLRHDLLQQQGVAKPELHFLVLETNADFCRKFRIHPDLLAEFERSHS